MRKDFLYFGLSLLTLCVPVALTSCSSDDPDNGGTNPNISQDAVKTSFTLSVGLPGGGSANAKPMTRMGEDITQAQEKPPSVAWTT